MQRRGILPAPCSGLTEWNINSIPLQGAGNNNGMPGRVEEFDALRALGGFLGCGAYGLGIDLRRYAPWGLYWE